MNRTHYWKFTGSIWLSLFLLLFLVACRQEPTPPTPTTEITSENDSATSTGSGTTESYPIVTAEESNPVASGDIDTAYPAPDISEEVVTPEEPEPPTMSRGGVAMLPASIYFLSATTEQLMRVENDAVEITQITNEAHPISDYDVAPDGSFVVYVSNNDLIRLDVATGQRQVKIVGAKFDPNNYEARYSQGIGSPRISPDGTQIAYTLAGVNTIPTDSNFPKNRVLESSALPDFSDPNVTLPEDPLRLFGSADWSPDSSKLLVSFGYFPEGGGMGLYDFASDTFTDLTLTNPGQVTCCEFAWNQDGSSGYFASEILTYGLPGLSRLDVENGIVTTLAGTEYEEITGIEQPDFLLFTAYLFRSVFVDADDSVLTFGGVTAEFAISPYTMLRFSPDGETQIPLRQDNYRMFGRDILWADDGSGVVITDEENNSVWWLPVNEDPPFALPITGHNFQWGGEAQVIVRESAESLTQLQQVAATNFGVEYPSANGDIGIQQLTGADGNPRWVAYTVGFRDYSPTGEHQLAIYAKDADTWQPLAAINYAPTEDLAYASPDHVGERSVREVFIEPSSHWLLVNGGVGVHGGVMQLLRFDGANLTLEVVNNSPSPSAGRIEDLNGDGQPDVLLDVSDPYIFAYATGVRLIDYIVMRWNGSELEEVTLQPLDEGADTALRETVNQAVSYAEAGLWRDALMLVEGIPHSAEQNDALIWNQALIELIANERRDTYQNFNPYRLITDLFYGDYAGAVNVMRGSQVPQDYTPADIFTLDTPLIIGTNAEGSQQYMSNLLVQMTTEALTIKPALAEAYFIRAWANYLLDPANPNILFDLEAAVTHAPNDPLFTTSLDFLR